ASSTGHFFVRDCPGGMRLSRRVSGEMITSGSVTSSGLRGAWSWYLGSLIRASRKLIVQKLSASVHIAKILVLFAPANLAASILNFYPPNIFGFADYLQIFFPLLI